MLEPLTTPDQFRHVLGSPALARHVRWAVHARSAHRTDELSTGVAPDGPRHVDESPTRAPRPSQAALGCVFPKRLARRAVTRGLLRRLARPVAETAQREVDEPLWWVLRLTAPIARGDFPSASSDPMRRQMRHEIETCFRLAVEGWRRRSARGSMPGARAGAGSCP